MRYWLSLIAPLGIALILLNHLAVFSTPFGAIPTTVLAMLTVAAGCALVDYVRSTTPSPSDS